MPTGMVVFRVADTGIGIAAAESVSRIFEEFAQVEHRLQRSVRGTGLGLPLSRRLAELLGGTLTLSERVRRWFDVHRHTADDLSSRRATAAPQVSWTADADELPVLASKTRRDAQFFYERMLKGSRFQTLSGTQSARSATLRSTAMAPAAIILDLVLAATRRGTC